METFKEFDPSKYRAPEQIEQSPVFENRSKLKEYLKKAVLKTAAFSVMFGSHMVGYAQTKASETRARFAPVTAEKLVKSENRESKRSSFTSTEIREGLLTDRRERIFISTDADSENELYEISGGGATSGYLDYEEINRMLSEKGVEISKLNVIHTHPREAYKNVFYNSGVSKKDQYEYQKGIKKLPPHPPSMADFQSQRNMQEYFEQQDIEVTSHVIDIGGTWKYVVDEDSKVLKDLANAQEEYAMNLEKKLTEEQWETVTKILQSGEVDPRLLANFLSNKPAEQDKDGSLRKIGEILTNLQTEINVKYNTANKIYTEIENKGANIILIQSEKEREKAIAEYIAFCKENGITVTYSPVKNN